MFFRKNLLLAITNVFEKNLAKSAQSFSQLMNLLLYTFVSIFIYYTEDYTTLPSDRVERRRSHNYDRLRIDLRRGGCDLRACPLSRLEKCNNN